MNDFDIPVFKKTYDFYKTFHECRRLVPKTDRFTTFERSEDAILDILEGIVRAIQSPRAEKVSVLERVNIKLNLLRVLLRLMKDTKVLDMKRYITFEEQIDEIGRMLGGWLRSLRI
jgi:hypothetical protein